MNTFKQSAIEVLKKQGHLFTTTKLQRLLWGQEFWKPKEQHRKQR